MNVVSFISPTEVVRCRGSCGGRSLAQQRAGQLAGVFRHALSMFLSLYLFLPHLFSCWAIKAFPSVTHACRHRLSSNSLAPSHLTLASVSNCGSVAEDDDGGNDEVRSGSV